MFPASASHSIGGLHWTAPNFFVQSFLYLGLSGSRHSLVFGWWSNLLQMTTRAFLANWAFLPGLSPLCLFSFPSSLFHRFLPLPSQDLYKNHSPFCCCANSSLHLFLSAWTLEGRGGGKSTFQTNKSHWNIFLNQVKPARDKYQFHWCMKAASPYFEEHFCGFFLLLSTSALTFCDS